MRKLMFLAVPVALMLMVQMASAQPYAFGFSGFTPTNNLTINGTTFDNTDSGWITDAGLHYAGNTNYYSGYQNCGNYCANYFSFDLSGLTGTVVSATFNVDAYQISDPGTYYVYATSLTPAEVDSSMAINDPSIYNAIVGSPVISSLAIGPGDSYNVITLNLDSTGLAWLESHEGGGLVLGGAFDPPNLATPEPATLSLSAVGFLTLAAVVLRRRRVAQQ